LLDRPSATCRVHANLCNKSTDALNQVFTHAPENLVQNVISHCLNH
jgi:hypothetical protein